MLETGTFHFGLTTVSGAMVWQGSPEVDKFEKNYIKNCLSEGTKKKIATFKDVSLSFLPHGCKDFDYSFNTLHHMFYAARCLEIIGSNGPKSIVEFGGGYGNLARIFKSLEPEATIFIIDIPEIIYLQAVFLRSTMPDVDVVIHDKNTKDFKKGSINLIPVYLLKDLDIKADLFVSTFALSETTSYIQNLVANKRFFNPEVCYITGQLSGWGKLAFENHSIIHDSLKSCFREVEINPSHIILSCGFKSYEAIAKNF